MKYSCARMSSRHYVDAKMSKRFPFKQPETPGTCNCKFWNSNAKVTYFSTRIKDKAVQLHYSICIIKKPESSHRIS